MDKQKAAADIIAAALPLIPFDGWNQQTLAKAAQDAGYKRTDVIRIFSGGAIEAVDTFLRNADAQMAEDLKSYYLEKMKIRERIATAVRIRISLHNQHREALRRTIAMQALPLYSMHALKNLYATVDAIWYAIGDTSTDFNFYTKRLTLAGVYMSTLLFWLDDKTPGFEASWEFLDRRIGDVMQIEKAKSKIKSWFERQTA
jgi:ubiquinone biosynthesis protein COQ9